MVYDVALCNVRVGYRYGTYCLQCVFSLAERLGFCNVWIAVSLVVRTIFSVYAVGQISVSHFDRWI